MFVYAADGTACSGESGAIEQLPDACQVLEQVTVAGMTVRLVTSGHRHLPGLSSC